MSLNELGIDIAEISRFRDLPYEKNKKFYEKIFVNNEIKYCLDKKDPYPHFAVRFAAKEAFFKASQKTLECIDVEIKNTSTGKPELYIHRRKTKNILLSLSHTKELAVAVVVINNS